VAIPNAQTGAKNGHTAPQAPQLLELVARFTHVAPHTVWPDGHAQAPATLAAPDGQETPQAPQLFVSLFRFTQLPVHTAPPDGHVQLPSAQVAPTGGGLPFLRQEDWQ
jgi:hypothetical protein